MTLDEFKNKHNPTFDDVTAINENSSSTITDGVIENCIKVNLRSSATSGLDSIITTVDCGVHVNIYPGKSTDKYWFVKTMDNEGFIDKRYVKVS